MIYLWHYRKRCEGYGCTGNSWMAGIPEEGTKTVMLVTDTKYGFRGLMIPLVSLIRSSMTQTHIRNLVYMNLACSDIVENALMVN